MDGYKAAFRGSMVAYGKLAVNSARWIRHITGTGGDSEPHYWPEHCEICKEIASHVSDWTDATEHRLAADLLPHERLPINEHIPAEGGSFFVHWVCDRCLPDDYDSSDSCNQCGKPRTDKTEAAKA
jgi:hypothetical protein